MAIDFMNSDGGGVSLPSFCAYYMPVGMLTARIDGHSVGCRHRRMGHGAGCGYQPQVCHLWSEDLEPGLRQRWPLVRMEDYGGSWRHYPEPLVSLRLLRMPPSTKMLTLVKGPRPRQLPISRSSKAPELACSLATFFEQETWVDREGLDTSDDVDDCDIIYVCDEITSPFRVPCPVPM